MCTLLVAAGGSNRHSAVVHDATNARPVERDRTIVIRGHGASGLTSIVLNYCAFKGAFFGPNPELCYEGRGETPHSATIMSDFGFSCKAAAERCPFVDKVKRG